MALFNYLAYMVKTIIKPKKKGMGKKKASLKRREKLPAVLLPVLNSPGKYIFFCPACQENHLISTVHTEFSRGHRLSGSLAKPTISPSVLSFGDRDTGKPRCHSFITAGKIKFMSDCWHAMAGKTVALKPLE